MTAVAPAVVVPLMIALVKEGYGLKKQIPIKIIASSTIENVAVLVLFGIFSSIAMNQVSKTTSNPGEQLGWSILEIFVGLFGGIAMGILGFLFKVKELQRFNNNIVKFLFICFWVLAMQILLELPSKAWKNTKFVGSATFGYILYKIWGNNKPQIYLKHLSTLMYPALFGCIGASIDFSSLNASYIGIGIGVYFFSMFF